MIENKNKVTLPDAMGVNDVEMEVNWSPLSTDKVKVKIGDKEAVIERQDLFMFMFVIAKPEQQDALTPVRVTKITKYFKQHRVKVGKDLKKGEELVVNCSIDVPTTVEQGLRGDIFSEKRSKSQILLPKG